MLASAARRCRRSRPPLPGWRQEARERRAVRQAGQQLADPRQRVRDPPEGGRLRPIDPLVQRQLQQFEAGPQQLRKVGRRQRRDRGLGLAAAKDLPPELRPPLQPIRQAPRRLPAGQPLAQVRGLAVRLEGLLLGDRQQQP
ncbi:hypothetical protein [Siccirubricoccus sp. G192]|uniref:hypothetical protein n=1 Tax=Siccirubricoccus sp. G192 TaxID=2849651 RepID=UPI001C2B7EED|nr:hypothetical protein [Siccirubricoccus sp. G192]MBV1800542.1 hypothetical protein [Siccirubricoccus sp. G192]